MKKLIALMLGVSLFSVNTWADIQMNYVKDGMTTTASRYSLAGLADPNYPLYINGKKVETTSEEYSPKLTMISQRVIVLSNGKIVADGNPHDILLNENIMLNNGLELPLGKY